MAKLKKQLANSNYIERNIGKHDKLVLILQPAIFSCEWAISVTWAKPIGMFDGKPVYFKLNDCSFYKEDIGKKPVFGSKRQWLAWHKSKRIEWTDDIHLVSDYKAITDPEAFREQLRISKEMSDNWLKLFEDK